MRERVDVAVVGAGPGGMEAATVAASMGLRVTIIDGYARPGGQYLKQLPKAFDSRDCSSHQKEAESAFRRLQQSGSRLLVDTLVWNVLPSPEGKGWLLLLYGTDAPDELHADAVILATGAYDRPMAFPGWTLPGVMTAGAVQTMIKSQRVLPGARFLLSGTGPLQWAVAAQLVRAGATVTAVLEGAQLGLRSARHAPSMWGQWGRLREGLDYFLTMRRAGVSFRTGWSVIEARGDTEVREAVIARLDRDWRPIPGSEEVVETDTLVIGYGFLPCTELSRLMGCQLEYVAGRGGFVPRRDELMRTTQPGVLAVGDGAGIGGAALARVEGHMAGIAAALQLGKMTEAAAENAAASWRPTLARERRFARLLGNLFTPGLGLCSSLATGETIVCRCEEVTRREVEAAIAMGCESVLWVKRMTRSGMGMCQGRVCGQLIAGLIAHKAQCDPGLLQPDTVRPPVRPVPLAIMAGEGDA